MDGEDFLVKVERNKEKIAKHSAFIQGGFTAVVTALLTLTLAGLISGEQRDLAHRVDVNGQRAVQIIERVETDLSILSIGHRAKLVEIVCNQTHPPDPTRRTAETARDCKRRGNRTARILRRQEVRGPR